MIGSDPDFPQVHGGNGIAGSGLRAAVTATLPGPREVTDNSDSVRRRQMLLDRIVSAAAESAPQGGLLRARRIRTAPAWSLEAGLNVSHRVVSGLRSRQHPRTSVCVSEKNPVSVFSVVRQRKQCVLLHPGLQKDYRRSRCPASESGPATCVCVRLWSGSGASLFCCWNPVPRSNLNTLKWTPSKCTRGYFLTDISNIRPQPRYRTSKSPQQRALLTFTVPRATPGANGIYS